MELTFPAFSNRRKNPSWTLAYLKDKLIKLEKYELVATKDFKDVWLKIHQFSAFSGQRLDHLREPTFICPLQEVQDGLRTFSAAIMRVPTPPLVDELVELAHTLTQLTPEKLVWFLFLVSPPKFWE